MRIRLCGSSLGLCLSIGQRMSDTQEVKWIVKVKRSCSPAEFLHLECIIGMVVSRNNTQSASVFPLAPIICNPNPEYITGCPPNIDKPPAIRLTSPKTRLSATWLQSIHDQFWASSVGIRWGEGGLLKCVIQMSDRHAIIFLSQT